MSGIKPTQKIYEVVKDINEDRYRLPSIQRTFVWGEERICKLMDSLMNDYPIGSFLVWKPNLEFTIRTRKLVQDYKTGERLISEEEPLESLPYLVLDGQQILQSLFLAFFGKYDGKRLYFKIDSNPDEEDNDLRYQFSFIKIITSSSLRILPLGFEISSFFWRSTRFILYPSSRCLDRVLIIFC